MYVRTREGLGQVVAAINLDRAVYLNRHYARVLGWQAHVSHILRLLGFTASVDATHFVSLDRHMIGVVELAGRREFFQKLNDPGGG